MYIYCFDGDHMHCTTEPKSKVQLIDVLSEDRVSVPVSGQMKDVNLLNHYFCQVNQPGTSVLGEVHITVSFRPFQVRTFASYTYRAYWSARPSLNVSRNVFSDVI